MNYDDISLVYAGILWISAAGQEERVGKARKIIIDSVVGLMIALSAYGITIFVSGKLGSTTTVNYGVCYGEQGGDCVTHEECQSGPLFTHEETKAAECLKDNKVCCIYTEQAAGGTFKCKAMGGECYKSAVGKWDCESGKEKIGNCDAPGPDLYHYCCRDIR